MDTLEVIKKKKLKIPNNLNLVKLWNLISPIVVEEVAPDFLPIPNLMDTNAFELGYIFVQTREQVRQFSQNYIFHLNNVTFSFNQSSCFGNSPLLKVLGPIKNYVKKAETDRKWLAKQFPTVKQCPEHKDFRV